MHAIALLRVCTRCTCNHMKEMPRLTAPPVFVTGPSAASAFNAMRQQHAAFVLGSRAHLEQQVRDLTEVLVHTECMHHIRRWPSGRGFATF